MALPGDVSTFTLGFGPYTDASGAVALVGAKGKLFPVDPVKGKRLNLVHIATGQEIIPNDLTVTIGSDGTASVGPIPHTDNPGLSTVGFAYRVEWAIASSKPSPGNLTFAAPAAAGATVDYDLLTPAEAVPGVAVPVVTGATGPAGTITSASATGLTAGAAPTVTLGGTPSARTIELGIPAGATGPAGTITSASASALAPGATPTVTLGGTPSARTIALGIPGATADDASVAGAISTPGSATSAALRAAVSVTTALIPLSNYLAPGQAMPNDGVTDAAPLINTAMNDLLTKANGPQPFGQICYVLDLGPGRFRTNSTIQPGGSTPTTQNGHVGIKGAGRNQTFILPYGATTAIAFNQVNDSQPAAVDCHFSDFTIDLTNATLGPAGASRKGFIGRGWFDCTWTRVRVRNSPATAFGTDFPVRCTFTACTAVKTSTGVNGTLDMSAGVIEAAKFWSGFGIGFGVFDGESVLFEGCDATDCFRGGFFFEAFEANVGNVKRTAVIRMVGCRASNNRIGVSNVGAGGVSATNCEFTDNTVAGYYGGVSGGTTLIASLNTTLDNCQILRNGYGIYATGDFTGAGHNYAALRDVLGGYRILNNRIEDNVLHGFLAERFKSVEAGGLTVRGNHFRRNGGGLTLRQAADPIRDLFIEDNYFDANTGTALSLLVAMNAPKITGNTFCNPVGGTAQTVGIEWHPAEPVATPLVTGNTYRRIATPQANAARLTPVTTGDRVLDATADTSTPWTYREAFYGGTATPWPVAGDGWAKNTGGSSADWLRATIGIAKGGSGTAISYIYRDLGVGGLYVSSRITAAATGEDPLLSQFIGVMHSLASSSARTALILGVNKAGVGQTSTSDFYALWQVVGGTYTRLWESTVPYNENHGIALARKVGPTVTDVFIDGKLVNTLDVPAVPVTSLAGVASVIITNQKRYLSEFRAMPYA